jgi:hypothetical protein
MASSNVASSNIHHFRKRINISVTLVSESRGGFRGGGAHPEKYDFFGVIS